MSVLGQKKYPTTRAYRTRPLLAVQRTLRRFELRANCDGSGASIDLTPLYRLMRRKGIEDVLSKERVRREKRGERQGMKLRLFSLALPNQPTDRAVRLAERAPFLTR